MEGLYLQFLILVNRRINQLLFGLVGQEKMRCLTILMSNQLKHIGYFRIVPNMIAFLGLLIGIGFFSSSSSYSQTQTFAWEYSFGDPGIQNSKAIAHDPISNTVVVGGVFQGNITLGDSSYSSLVAENIWLSKMDDLGNVIWSLHAPSTSSDDISDIAIDDMENIYVFGTYTGTTSFIGVLGTSFSLSSQGMTDLFVVKYNSAGEIQWAQTLGGSGDEVSGGVTSLAGNDNIFVTGGFSGTATFQSPPNLTSSGGQDAFVMAINRVSGNKLWIRQGSCAEDAFGTGITVDGSGIYACGNYLGNSPLTFDGFGTGLANIGVGGQNMYLIKYALNGSSSWQRYAGNGTGTVLASGVSVSGGTSVYLTGAFDGTTSFSTNFLFTNITSVGMLDVFLAGYDRNTGLLLNLDGYGGPGDDIGTSISLSNTNDLFISAIYNDSMFIGTDTLVPTGIDALIASFSQTGATYNWSIPISGASDQYALDVSAPIGEIYTAGFFSGVSNFIPFTSSYSGLSDAFAAKVGCPNRLSPNILNSLAGQDTLTCLNDPINLNGSPFPPFTGQWNILSGIGGLSNPSAPNAVLSPGASGSIEMEWVLTNGTCIIQDTMLVSVPASFALDAGPDTTICTTSYSMMANDPNPNSGTWTLLTGSGVISNVNLFNTPLTALGFGPNEFEWAVSDGLCTLFDTVTITVNPPLNPTTGPDTIVCDSVLTLNGNDPAPNSGVWTQVSGLSASIANANQYNSQVTLGSGQSIFIWEINDGTCMAHDSFKVEYLIPIEAIAGPDTSICGTAYMMQAGNPSPGIGVWASLAGPGTTMSLADPNSAVIGLSPTISEFTWTVSTSGICTDVDTVEIQGFTGIAVDAGPDDSICFGSSTFLQGSNPSPGLGQWTVISGSAVVANPSLFNSSISSPSIGNSTLVWEITNGPCITTDTLTFTVSAPTQANAGGNVAVCGDSIVLSGNNPLPFSGIWTTISGGGTFSNVNDSNATVTNMALGINEFCWTITDGGCSTADTVVIVSDAPIVANAGMDLSICSTAVTLSGNIIMFSSGGWEVASGGGTLVSPFLPTTDAINLTAGANDFAWILLRGACSDTDTVTITVFDPPTPAAAGSPIAICNDTFVNLTGNNPLIGTGAWSNVSGPGNIVAPSNPVSLLNGLQPGTASFEWAITNGVCPVSRDTLDITVSLEITALAGNDTSLCDTAGTTLNGSPPGTGMGTWSVLSGSGNFTNPNDPLTYVDGLANGVNELVWTIVNGPCTTQDTVEVLVTFRSSIANAGPDQPLCGIQTINLVASNPNLGIGLWSDIGGTSPTISSTSDPNAILTGVSVGVNTLEWSIVEGACESRDTIVIDITAPPAPANAGPDDSLCNLLATTLVGSDTNGVIGTWTVASGTGMFVNPGDSNTAVSGLSSGLNQFAWTTTVGSCSSSDTVDIWVTLPSVLPLAGMDQFLCGIQKVGLNANDPGALQGTWSSIPTGVIFTNPNLYNDSITGLNTGINQLVWTIVEGACTHSDTVVVEITDPPALPSAGSDTSLCNEFSTVLMGSDTTGVSASWTLVSGTGTIVNPIDSNSTVNLLSAGLNQFAWTITSGYCTFSDTVDISITVPSILPLAGVDQFLCDTQQVTLAGNDPGSLLGTWSSIPSGAIFTNPNRFNDSVNGLAWGVNQLIWTIEEGPCIQSDTVIIDITPPPLPANAGTDDSLCNLISTGLDGSDTTGGIGAWSVVSGTGMFVNPNDSTTVVNGLSAGLNQFCWTTIVGNCRSEDTVDIHVTIPSVLPLAGTDQLLCDTQTVLLNGNDPGSLPGTWSATSASANFSNNNLYNSAVSGLPAGANQLIWSIEEGSCNLSDTVLIDITLPIPQFSAGPTMSLCDTLSTNLVGTDPMGGTGIWQVIFGNGAVAIPNDPITTINVLSRDSNLVSWTVTQGNCVQIDTILIYVTIPSVLPQAGIDQNICLGDTILLNGNSPPLNGTGVWQLPISQGTIDNPTDSSTFATGFPLGQQPIVWFFTENSCKRKDTLMVTVLPIPQPDAGSDESLCDTNSTTLSGQTFGNGNGVWNIINGPGTVVNSLDSNSILNGLQIGTTSLTWTVDNGSCDATDTVEVTVISPPDSVNAGIDQSICASGNATLNATIPIVGTGIWSSLGAATLDSISSPQSGVQDLVTGPNIFVWTVSLPLCQDRFDTVVIDVNLLHMVDAGDDQTICYGDSTILMGQPFTGFGLWSHLTGNATFSTPDTYTTQTINLDSGINTFILTVYDGPCMATDTVLVQADLLPSVADAGPDQDVPNDFTTLAANTPLVGIGTWTVLQGTGTWSDASSPISEVSELTLGENVYAWTISNGTCPSTTDSVRINVLDLLIPTGFSPNGDGRNDTWLVRGGHNFGTIQVQVFNRWGNLVYHANDYQNNWDGRSDNGSQLADDTYYYIVRIGTGEELNGYVVIKR